MQWDAEQKRLADAKKADQGAQALARYNAAVAARERDLQAQQAQREREQQEDRRRSPQGILEAFAEGFQAAESGTRYTTAPGELHQHPLPRHYAGDLQLTGGAEYVAWANPEPRGVWQYQQSITIQQLIGNRMFPLSVKGLEETMRLLSK